MASLLTLTCVHLLGVTYQKISLSFATSAWPPPQKKRGYYGGEKACVCVGAGPTLHSQYFLEGFIQYSTKWSYVFLEAHPGSCSSGGQVARIMAVSFRSLECKGLVFPPATHLAVVMVMVLEVV